MAILKRTAGAALALLLWQAQAQAQQRAAVDPPTLEELLKQSSNEVTRDIEESTSSRFARSAGAGGDVCGNGR